MIGQIFNCASAKTSPLLGCTAWLGSLDSDQE